MQISDKPVALHYRIKELPLTKMVKDMIHMTMNQEVMIVIPKAVDMHPGLLTM
jgi:hypothetical protein